MAFKRNLFNSMGYSAQLGKLGNCIGKLTDWHSEAKDNVADIDAMKKLITCTITFDSDGGTDVESQSTFFGDTVTEPENPTKDGYNFVEWQDVETSTAFDFDTAVKKNYSLKAKWVAS